MQISELVGILNRVQSIAGDVGVVFKDAVSEAETVVHGLSLKLDATGNAGNGSLIVEHGAQADTPAPPAGDPPVEMPQQQS